MALVTVKKKYQIVLPQSLRGQVGVSIGDVLEAKIERGRITLTPKPVVDRGIAKGLEDIKAGRVHGPYGTVAEAMRGFQKRSAKFSKEPKPAQS